MVPALIGAIVGATIGARKTRTKRVYAQRFKELWEGIHAILTKMAQGVYSLATQEAAVREMAMDGSRVRTNCKKRFQRS
jgi:hypothetical protein